MAGSLTDSIRQAVLLVAAVPGRLMSKCWVRACVCRQEGQAAPHELEKEDLKVLATGSGQLHAA